MNRMAELVCPTSYSCHVDSRHFHSNYEAKRSGYRVSRYGYLRIRYSSITRWTWHFRIYLGDIREYLVSGNSLSTSGGTVPTAQQAYLLQLAGHKASRRTCQYFHLPIYLHLDLSISLFETSKWLLSIFKKRIFQEQILVKAKKIRLHYEENFFECTMVFCYQNCSDLL